MRRLVLNILGHISAPPDTPMGDKPHKNCWKCQFFKPSCRPHIYMCRLVPNILSRISSPGLPEIEDKDYKYGYHFGGPALQNLQRVGRRDTFLGCAGVRNLQRVGRRDTFLGCPGVRSLQRVGRRDTHFVLNILRYISRGYDSKKWKINTEKLTAICLHFNPGVKIYNRIRKAF